MRKKRIIPILVIAMLYLVWRVIFSNQEMTAIHLQGTTMGPIPYSIKYIDDKKRSFQADVDSLLIAFNNSLSTYIPNSEISKFNANDSLTYETSFFYPVLKMSKEVYENSDGSFDPTIGPLINAWGFGPERTYDLDSSMVDSLLNIIGFDKVTFDEKAVVKKKNMYIDFSAIAKGNGIDIVASFLQSKGINNYMVEIGGEVACMGNNHYNEPWSIGIERPAMNEENMTFAIAKLKNMALATSGNYRNYYLKDGKIIAHTISPHTGYPVRHNLLSASIFSKNCTLSDAYATACMVMGLEDSKKMIQETKEIECLLIYSNEEGKMETFISDGIASQIELL